MLHGDLLAAFVEAVLKRTSDRSRLREEIGLAAGDAAVVDCCATIASFNAVVKIADGTGIPLEDWKEKRTRDLRQALAIDTYRHG